MRPETAKYTAIIHDRGRDVGDLIGEPTEDDDDDYYEDWPRWRKLKSDREAKECAWL
mgnify:CR=1 FL=1